MLPRVGHIAKQPTWVQFTDQCADTYPELDDHGISHCESRSISRRLAREPKDSAVGGLRSLHRRRHPSNCID